MTGTLTYHNHSRISLLSLRANSLPAWLLVMPCVPSVTILRAENRPTERKPGFVMKDSSGRFARQQQSYTVATTGVPRCK